MIWHIKDDLPDAQSIKDSCNDYYLVKVKGYSPPVLAMYLEDKNGKEGWYINYFSKIVEEVEAWAYLD